MSASIKAKITPEVLIWARNGAGFSQEEVAEKLNQKSATGEVIEAWEQGREQPTYAQLEKLANIYKRPIAVFYFPSPPEETTPNQKFRSLPDTFAQSLPPRMRYLVRKALAKQMNLYDLFGEDLSVDVKIFKRGIGNASRGNAKSLAAKMRRIIGVSQSKQFKWETEDEALKQWRKELENIGIWIFKDAFKSIDYCGFCLYDEKFPLIYLNNSIPKSRQIFTLFHETGHLLIAKGGVDFRHNVEHQFQGIYRQEEIFCNAFAAEFLVPSENFPIVTVPDDKQISDCAKKYNVSHEVILRRCFENNLITNEFYNNKVKEWHESWESRNQNVGKEGGGNYYATQKSYLGDKYLTLLFRQYYQQRIDEYKLADYLGIKVGSIQSLEGYLLGGKG